MIEVRENNNNMTRYCMKVVNNLTYFLKINLGNKGKNT